MKKQSAIPFDGPAWTRKLKFLLRAGDIEEAARLANEDLSLFPSGEHTRVKQMRALVTSISEIESRKIPPGYIPIKLEENTEKFICIDNTPDNIFELKVGLYRLGSSEMRPTSFSSDFAHISAREKRLFSNSRFDGRMIAGQFREFRRVESAFICGIDTMMHAYAFNGNQYIPEDSARIAKAHSRTYRFPGKMTTPKALLLPIPHHPKNYYHVVAEMIYGLSFAKSTGSCPIIYQTDNYNILRTICLRIGVDEKRLQPFNDVRNVVFDQAIIPTHPPYYWNKSVFDFFHSTSGSEKKPRSKLYLSRRKSSRGPSNELKIEETLEKRGYTIVFAEDLSISEQIDTFASAAIVVAPHGAGLANTAFMKADTGLVELFPSGMLVRDFYMRTRHNRMPYASLVYDNTVDLDQLIGRVTKVEKSVPHFYNYFIFHAMWAARRCKGATKAWLKGVFRRKHGR